MKGVDVPAPWLSDLSTFALGSSHGANLDRYRLETFRKYRMCTNSLPFLVKYCFRVGCLLDLINLETWVRAIHPIIRNIEVRLYRTHQIYTKNKSVSFSATSKT